MKERALLFVAEAFDTSVCRMAVIVLRWRHARGTENHGLDQGHLLHLSDPGDHAVMWTQRASDEAVRHGFVIERCLVVGRRGRHGNPSE